mmetsp:Transcript_134958/g.319921  ORF Transcript_134958/g.319921 Transcript_134958/m.319921 type:complete len:241 (-) Transcript_134958:2-724(-)
MGYPPHQKMSRPLVYTLSFRFPSGHLFSGPTGPRIGSLQTFGLGHDVDGEGQQGGAGLGAFERQVHAVLAVVGVLGHHLRKGFALVLSEAQHPLAIHQLPMLALVRPVILAILALGTRALALDTRRRKPSWGGWRWSNALSLQILPQRPAGRALLLSLLQLLGVALDKPAAPPWLRLEELLVAQCSMLAKPHELIPARLRRRKGPQPGAGRTHGGTQESQHGRTGTVCIQTKMLEPNPTS